MVGNQYERVDILLQAENIFLGIAFYIIALIIEATYKKKDKKLTFIPLIVTLMFMASRFSYYSYTEVLGIMENIAMLCAILFVLFLLKDNFTLGKNYWIANFIYVIAIYTHERYFVLAGVLIVYLGMCWMMNKRKLSFSKKSWVLHLFGHWYFPLLFLEYGFCLSEIVCWMELAEQILQAHFRYWFF